MTNPRPYKLIPGSVEAQAIELLRSLPADIALNSSELRDRLGWQSAKGVGQKLLVAARRGALRAEKRFDAASNCLRTYWMAGGAR